MDRRTFTRNTSKEDKTRLILTLLKDISLGVFIILSIPLLLTGCDKYTRYEVLSFFFTGVPHPDEVREKEKEIKRPLTPEELYKIRAERYKVIIYSHGPYGAQQCYQCHSTTKSAVFRSSVKQKQKKRSPIISAQEIAGRLVKPLNELCIDCHTEKSMISAYNRGLWVHGPVSSGLCTVCHSPHSSKYPFMLLSGKTNEMCRSCHAEGYIMPIEDHKKDMDCTECHNPHIGKNRFLLKKDFDEGMLW